MADDQTRATKALDEYSALLSQTQPEDQQNLASLKADWQRYLGLQQILFPISRRDDNKTAEAFINGPMAGQFARVLDDYVTMRAKFFFRAHFLQQCFHAPLQFFSLLQE